jgi:hypothetical protein
MSTAGSAKCDEYRRFCGRLQRDGLRFVVFCHGGEAGQNLETVGELVADFP